jgi:hypothetical protein
MPQLCMLTVPGLQVKSDWVAVHARLLDDFPEVTDVLATTMTATLLIVYEGEVDVDAWLDGVGQAILARRMRAGAGSRNRTDRRGASASGLPRADRKVSSLALELTTTCSSPGGTDGLGAGRAGLDVPDDSILKREGHYT